MTEIKIETDSDVCNALKEELGGYRAFPASLAAAPDPVRTDLAERARILELERVLREVRRAIDPECDPTRLRYEQLIKLVNDTLSAPQPLSNPLTAWQSIDTAPRDGTAILATGGGLDDSIQIISYCEQVGAWETSEVTLDDRDFEADGYSRPTHWMLLPAPPVTRPHQPSEAK